jgi:ERO1-like protein beta
MKFFALLCGIIITCALSLKIYDWLQCQICEIPVLTGQVDNETCKCEIETIHDSNNQHFLPLLTALTRTKYFRYFQVDLWRSCPFWEDDGQCAIRQCSVCECDESEIPQCWKEEEDRSNIDRVAEAGIDEQDPSCFSLSKVDPTSISTTNVIKTTLHQNEDDESLWSVIDTASPDLKYVNLLDNPEGYTGYNGPKIWNAIYAENCFHEDGTSSSVDPASRFCHEELILYRALSGLHASINTHIAMTYGDGKGSNIDLFTSVSLHDKNTTVPSFFPRGLNMSSLESLGSSMLVLLKHLTDSVLSVLSGQRTPIYPGYYDERTSSIVLKEGIEPSIEMYKTRLAKHPERLRNLYFTFLLVARSVEKGKKLFEELEFSSGNETEEAITKELVKQITRVQAPAILTGFDETKLFRSEKSMSAEGGDEKSYYLDQVFSPSSSSRGDEIASSELLKKTLREKYRNISRIMDCVGCEKCRLWGKLQFLGLGTAMKILFAQNETLDSISLSRNEAVALINVFHRLAMSISAIDIMRDLDTRNKLYVLVLRSVITVVIATVSFLLVRGRK